jgi:hypothetical protein
VQWSVGSSPHAVGTPLPIPTQLPTGNTYLILSEIKYLYVPTINFGNLMPTTGVNLSDVAYTRPRQSLCVIYNTTICTTIVQPS